MEAAHRHAPRAAADRSARPELADILRVHGDELGPVPAHQRRAIAAITRCRTAALGGHSYRCDECGHLEVFYNSCRDRHCPKCQALAQARWLEARQRELLPVGYFHVVFTVPHELHPFFRADPRHAHALLFAATAETLEEVALNPRHLGAKIGFMAVLHTWTQTLLFHPHLHCVVPAGGLDPSDGRWVDAKRGFFLPVRVLSTVFRGKLLSKVEAALAAGALTAPPGDARRVLQRAARKRWVVYCKAPFAGPEKVLAYLGRYTHRVAISNHRLVAFGDGKVTFRYRDRADGDRAKTLELGAVDFLHRFLAHVLPAGFMRIRHFGFMANGVKRDQLARCREQLAASGRVLAASSLVPDVPDPPERWNEQLRRLTSRDALACPVCEHGRLVCRGLVAPEARTWNVPGRGTSP